MIFYNNNYTELYHHGILGQKWGIRRYQNYDGTYTQAGMKRYNKSKENYENKKSAYKQAKKEGTATNQMKIQKLNAKNQMIKDYKHLKQDKLGDEGKLLYAKGDRIRENNNETNRLFSISTTIAGAALLAKEFGYITTDQLIGAEAVAGGVASVAAGKRYIDHYKNKRLSAYYSHTSNY